MKKKPISHTESTRGAMSQITKLAATTLLFFTFISSVHSAEPTASATIKPQPRVRLQQTSQGTVAQIERSTSPTADSGTVLMDKVVVADSKLPGTPNQRVEPEPTTFSITGGGPIVTGKIGTLPFAVGLWPWVDVMADDAKFKPARNRIDLEIVRIRF